MSLAVGAASMQHPRAGFENLAMATDPWLAAMLDARRETRREGPYAPVTLANMQDACASVVKLIDDGLSLTDVARLGGGASKEQFVLSATDRNGGLRRYVVRTDPLEAVAATDRLREAEAMRAAAPHIPTPTVAFVDGDGSYFQQPTLVMEFVPGVTKPTATGPAVSGIGAVLGERHRAKLRPQFVSHLAKLHDIDVTGKALPHHALPRPDSDEAARWQLAFWDELWRQDALEPVPLITVARSWLWQNAPICKRPGLVHADYRTGNYLFDEQSTRITAILDWELAHVGDYHEDVAHVLTPVTMVFDGVWRANDLFEPDAWLEAYEQASGRPVIAKTLHFYRMLAAYKSYVATVATAASVARAQHSHQDILLTTLPALGPSLLAHICDLLEAA